MKDNLDEVLDVARGIAREIDGSLDIALLAMLVHRTNIVITQLEAIYQNLPTGE